MSRITIKLNDKEMSALSAISQEERRHPSDQVAILLRDRLIQLGRLPTQPPAPAPTPQQTEVQR